jgi:AcrR family transcriptional regulator
MGIAERKQRAFDARERLVVETADFLLREHGYLGLNLDEVAERVEYSKATLYHHFSSKEDLVLAVVMRHMDARRQWFQRAVGFAGLTREKIFACGIADRVVSRTYPHAFPLMQLIRMPSIWSKCSEERKAKYGRVGEGCMGQGFQIAAEAAAQGDFEAWSPSPEQVIWGLVSLSMGAHLLAEDGQREGDENPDAPLEVLFDNYHRYLDGAGWRPFSRDFDYEASRRRIEEQLFSTEIQALA